MLIGAKRCMAKIIIKRGWWANIGGIHLLSGLFFSGRNCMQDDSVKVLIWTQVTLWPHLLQVFANDENTI